MSSALEGIRVIDISRVLAGPYCTQTLGDHGAEIVKIEPPVGDDTRRWGPPFSGDQSAYYAGLNRNKRGMALDLSQQEGREILLRLLEVADVLVHNFKPGTLEKWNLGYAEVLAPRFPRLICCQISGFGATGPLGGFPGYDAVIQAMTGLAAINGNPDDGPTRMGIPVVDIGTGLIACNAILAAMVERSKSGLGQVIDVSLYDCGIALLHPFAANYLMSGDEPVPTGNGHPNIVPYTMFDAADGRIYLAIGNDAQFAKLCVALGCPEVAEDPRFINNASRLAHREDLTDLLSGRMKSFSAHELEAELLGIGVPAGVVRSVGQALSHPHTDHCGMVARLGSYSGTGIPARLSRTPGAVTLPPPNQGEHNDDILRAAGYSNEEIAHFKRAGGSVIDQAGDER